MAKITLDTESGPLVVDLKNPIQAGVLAWLVPGLGHLYQGRTAKGLVFMICILSTFFFGLWLGHGRAVYAEWRPSDRRPAYFCQVGAGVVALPAVIQTMRVHGGKEPLFGGLMAPPETPEIPGHSDELAQWHYDWNRYFELGTLYTMIAGLLNVLAIYDACAGPVQIVPDEKKKKEPDEKEPDTNEAAKETVA